MDNTPKSLFSLVSSGREAVDLCTLKMVAGLRGGRGSVRAVCARWVEQCIARGDTGRLIEPLLLTLLDPVILASYWSIVLIISSHWSGHGAGLGIARGGQEGAPGVQHPVRRQQDRPPRPEFRSQDDDWLEHHEHAPVPALPGRGGAAEEVLMIS